jgi:hypothetical protein
MLFCLVSWKGYRMASEVNNSKLLLNLFLSWFPSWTSFRLGFLFADAWYIMTFLAMVYINIFATYQNNFCICSVYFLYWTTSRTGLIHLQNYSRGEDQLGGGVFTIQSLSSVTYLFSSTELVDARALDVTVQTIRLTRCTVARFLWFPAPPLRDLVKCDRQFLLLFCIDAKLRLSIFWKTSWSCLKTQCTVRHPPPPLLPYHLHRPSGWSWQPGSWRFTQYLNSRIGNLVSSANCLTASPFIPTYLRLMIFAQKKARINLGQYFFFRPIN